MSTIITIDNYAALYAFLNIAAKKDIRYYLNGIFVEAVNGETRLVATNGHILAVYRMFCANKVEEEENKVEFIIPREVIEKIKPVKGCKYASIERGEGKEMTIIYGGVEMSFTPIDGKFVEYTRVIPNDVSGEIAQYNPEYLMTFQKTARAISGNKETLVEVYHNGDTGGLINSGDSNFIGVIMPLRTTGNIPKTEWACKRVAVNKESLYEDKQEEVTA